MGNAPFQPPGQFQPVPQQQQGGYQQQQSTRQKVTDWNAAPEGTVSKLDPTDDPWAFSPPPPMGDYRLKLMIDREGMQCDVKRDGNPKNPEDYFYTVNLECRIVSENREINNFPTFEKVNTIIGRGKDISTMAGLLVKLGVQIPPQASDKQIAQYFEQVLKGEPVVWAFCDWRLRFEDQPGRWISKYDSMGEFPSDASGNKQHEVTVTHSNGGTSKERAKFNIVSWGTPQAAPQRPQKTLSAGAPGAFGSAPPPQGNPAPFPGAGAAPQSQGGPFAQAAPAQGQPAQFQPTQQHQQQQPQAPPWQQAQPQQQPQQQQTNAAPQQQQQPQQGGAGVNDLLNQ